MKKVKQFAVLGLGRFGQALVKTLAENGHILLSGFYTEDADDISKHAETLGLTVVNTFSENNWTVLELVRR